MSRAYQVKEASHIQMEVQNKLHLQVEVSPSHPPFNSSRKSTFEVILKYQTIVHIGLSGA